MEFVQGTLCATNAVCREHAAALLSADSIDINYDALSHSLALSGLWLSSPEGGWTEEIGKHDAGASHVEVGILGCEKAADPEELKIGGLLAVVGENEKLSMSQLLSYDRFLLLIPLLLQSQQYSLSHLAIILYRMMRLIQFHSLRQRACIRR